MKRTILVLAVFLSGCGGKPGSTEPTGLHGAPVTPAVPAPDFTLTDHAGHRISLAAQRGHWVIITFLYTKCPDVCPLIAGHLNGALRTAAAKRAGLRVLAVSVDPVGDTPAAARRYVRERALLPTFSYLIGSEAQLAPVWADYHVAAVPGPSGTITHGAFEMLIDPQGQERVWFESTASTADFLHDLALIEPSS
ncbi:MAG: SCO family protein [Actinomycetes bacterium]